MSHIQIIDVTSGHPYVQGVDLGPVGGPVRDLAKRHSYWDPEVKFRAYRRRVGRSAMAPSVSDYEFRETLYEIAKTDERMAPFETKFRDAFGPYQQNDPEGLKKSLEDYFTYAQHQIPDHTKAELKACFDLVLSELKSVMEDEAPISLDDAYENMPSGTNSGLPFYTSRRWTPEMKEYYMAEAKEIIDGTFNKEQIWYVLSRRLQPKGWETTKIRPVWGPKKSEYLAAQTISAPLMQLMQKLECYQGYNGPHTLTPVFKGWFDDASLAKFVSLDYSQYDATVVPFLMEETMRVISTLFPESETLCQSLLWIYTQGAILVPRFEKSKGLQIWCGYHGVPSGIGFTFATSLINRAVMHFIMRRLKITKYRHICNGDDTALAIAKTQAKRFVLEKVSKLAAEVGLIINPDPRKQELCERGIGNELSPEAYVTFLGRYFFESNQEGIMPIMRMATGLYYWENYIHKEQFLSRLQWYIPGKHNASRILEAADCITVIQKLENCKAHAALKDFVIYVMMNTPGFLDPNLWMSDMADSIAIHTRSGRISRMVGLKAYKSVRVILESHYTLVAKTGKTIAQIYSDLAHGSADFFPDHEEIEDHRHFLEITDRTHQVKALDYPKPSLDKDPKQLETEYLIMTLVNPETQRVAEEAKAAKKVSAQQKKLRMHMLDRDDVVKQLEAAKAKKASKTTVTTLVARVAQLDAIIAQVEESIAERTNAQSDGEGGAE